MRHLTAILFLSIMCLSVSGCSDNENTEVTDIYTANSTIEIDEPAIFDVDFDFNSNDVFDDGETVSLVVKVPAGLSYLRGSAQLNQWGSNDLAVPPVIRRCTDGSTYLAFVFDDNDLDDGQSSGNADAELSLTLVGARRGQALAVEATASIESVPYGCRETFTADQQEIVDVE